MTPPPALRRDERPQAGPPDLGQPDLGPPDFGRPGFAPPGPVPSPGIFRLGLALARLLAAEEDQDESAPEGEPDR